MPRCHRRQRAQWDWCQSGQSWNYLRDHLDLSAWSSHRSGLGDCPSGQVSGRPSGQVGGRPSGQAGGRPSGQVGGRPSGQVGGRPSGQVGGCPSGQAGGHPSGQVGGHPSGRPSGQVGGDLSGQAGGHRGLRNCRQSGTLKSGNDQTWWNPGYEPVWKVARCRGPWPSPSPSPSPSLARCCRFVAQLEKIRSLSLQPVWASSGSAM